MRIISGEFKGLRFKAPAKIKARPTTDFAKESLFNILGNEYDLSEVEVLDLFSGIGSISFEFASRGAQRIVSVDKGFPNIQFIKEFFQKLGYDKAHVVKDNVFSYLDRCEGGFDIVFADPPYGMEDIEKIPEIVFRNELLNQGGSLIVEHDAYTNLANIEYFTESRKYGNVNFSFFKKEEE